MIKMNFSKRLEYLKELERKIGNNCIVMLHDYDEESISIRVEIPNPKTGFTFYYYEIQPYLTKNNDRGIIESFIARAKYLFNQELKKEKSKIEHKSIEWKR